MASANYVLLERIELNATTASVTFANIPQSGYTDLKLVASMRCTNTFGNAWYDTYITVNSGAALSWRDAIGLGSGTPSSRSGSSDFVTLGVSSSGATTSAFGNVELYFSNYNSTTTYKPVTMDGVSENNATAAGGSLSAGLYASNTPISSITITPYNSPTGSFAQFSTFSLYGLAAVGTTPVIAPKATGGNIYNDGTYWYHTFLTSGTFTPLQSLSANILVVAGGGGGGGTVGGGGGAGGLLGFTAQSLTTTSYTCQVGAGGTGSTTNTNFGGNGSLSQFGALTTAVGGGGGVGIDGGNGSTGGSGGGSSGLGGTEGSGTSGQGYSGGVGAGQLGGGGGGANAVGGGYANYGAGGVGSSAYSTWGAATGQGENVSGTYYFAGGGGGGTNNAAGGNANTTLNVGGYGGGGRGQTSTGPGIASGTVNTGGGGGGGRGNGSYAGASGGSGIIIIRYAMA